MSGARPAAITSHSACAGSPATVNVTPSSPDTTFSTNTPVRTVMPCFLKPRSAIFEMSASSVGSTRSRPS